MAGENNNRIPESYLSGWWEYVATITAKNGRLEDFLLLCDHDKEDVPDKLYITHESSSHLIIAKSNPLIIDIYRGRNANTKSYHFSKGVGSCLWRLAQAGYTTDTKEDKKILQVERKADGSDRAKVNF